MVAHNPLNEGRTRSSRNDSNGSNRSISNSGNSGASSQATSRAASVVSRPRRGRGPTLLSWLINRPPRTPKEKLEWNAKNEIVGPGKAQTRFSDSIGVFMNTSRRFEWAKSWNDQNPASKQWLWNALNEVWELEECRMGRVLSVISSQIFRTKKTTWKRNCYAKYATNEERLAHKPPRMTRQEWISLLQHWGSEEHQAISERNKENKGKQELVHTGGRKSQPRYMHEMTMERGAPPELGDFFVATHTSARTNEAIDDTSRRYIAEIREKAGTDEHGNPNPLTTEIYFQVTPPEHRLRVLMGTGDNPASVTSTTSASTNAGMNELAQKVVDLEKQLKEKDDQIEHDESTENEDHEVENHGEDEDEQAEENYNSRLDRDYVYY